jgi:hypothetical protein
LLIDKKKMKNKNLSGFILLKKQLIIVDKYLNFIDNY